MNPAIAAPDAFDIVDVSVEKGLTPDQVSNHFSDIFTDFLYNNFNSCLESGMFPDELKLA